MMGIALLAAGLGRRFQGEESKLLAPFKGRPLYTYALESLSQIPAHKVFVTRPDFMEVIESQGLPHPQAYGFEVILNPRPQRGQGYSTALAARCFLNTPVTGVLYCVCDQPFLSRETLQTLIRAFESDPTTPVRASYAGRPGNPVLFPARTLKDLAALDGDLGGRAVLQKEAYIHYVPCPVHEGADIDTRDQFTQMEEL